MISLKDHLYQLLRITERYIKTDMVYLARGSFWLFIGQVVTSLGAFLLAIAFANLMPPAVYGSYRYILSIAGLVSIATLPGMRAAVVRATAQGRSSAIYAATRERLVVSFLGTAGTFALAGYYGFIGGNLTLAAALCIVALTLPFFEVFDLYGSYLNGIKRFDIQTRYAFITQALSVSVLIATVFLTDNLLLLLLAYFLPLAAIRYLLYKRTCRAIPHTSEPATETIIYGRHQTIMAALSIVALSIDKMLLWHALGPAQLAVYTFAIALPEHLKGPLKSVGDLALPQFVRRNEENLRVSMSLFWRKMALYCGAVFTLSLIYIAAAPYLYHLFFPAYDASILYSQVFALSLCTVVSTVPVSLLTAQHKLREQYTLSTVQPLVQILLFATLIPLYGIMGAIVAWVATRFIMLVYICILTDRAFR